MLIIVKAIFVQRKTKSNLSKLDRSFHYKNLETLRKPVITKKTSKPNVVFIIFDDLRPALGSYGDKEAVTPNMDRLASKSTVFQAAFAQQALCGPSRTSLFISRRPDTSGAYTNGFDFRKHTWNFTTLPQYFRENGYYAASYGKTLHGVDKRKVG